MKRIAMIAVFMVGLVVLFGGSIFAQQETQLNSNNESLTDYSEFQRLYKEKEDYMLFQMRSMDLLSNDQ